MKLSKLQEPQKSEAKQLEDHIKIIDDFCAKAFGHHRISLANEEAEVNTIQEALKYAVNHNVSRIQVEAALIRAGYTEMQAKGYASGMKTLQGASPQVKELLNTNVISYSDAIDRARSEKIASKPNGEELVKERDAKQLFTKCRAFVRTAIEKFDVSDVEGLVGLVRKAFDVESRVSEAKRSMFE